MKITARAARYLTGANRPARSLTPADVCAERAAMYGPCGDPACTTCGPRPPVSCVPGCPEHLPGPAVRITAWDIDDAIEAVRRREQRRAELDSCEDFGVDPRFI